MDPDHYYAHFAAAYVRGSLPALTAASDSELWPAARKAELRLHRFKRTAGLPRVRRAIGALRGLGPTSLLDIGSGRGAFLWPLLDEMAHLRVLAVDRLAHRAEDIAAVARGGVDRLGSALMDVRQLALRDASFDVVTILEVLEHLQEPERAAREVVRVARDAVVASVPSREDDNPEHLRVYTRESLTTLFMDAGARRVTVDFVAGHMVAVVGL